MELALQMAVNATALAAVYALFGLSFSFIYAATGIMHFAHGATFTVAAYLFYLLYTLLDAPLVPAAAGAVVGAALFGWAVMRGFYQPLQRLGASPALVMIASLGLFIVIDNLIVLVFGADSRVADKGGVASGMLLGPVYITPLQLWTVAVAVLAVGGTALLLTRTRLGQAIRGMSDDPGFAAIIGIDIGRLGGIVFALGSALLALGAVVVSLDIGVSPGASLRVVLIAAVASILGGTATIYGGLAGGVIVALLESGGGLAVDPRWQNVIVFGALIAVLLVRPAGLFARIR